MKAKAILLAAGLGTRLRPITDSIPKCLVKIGGQPLLGRWIDQFERIGCSEVLVNTHYKADMVTRYIEGKTTKAKIKVAYEEHLLGTCGTLLKHRGWIGGDDFFLVHADNYCEERLEKLVEALNCRNEELYGSMLVFKTRDYKSSGMLAFDGTGILDDYVEKGSDKGYEWGNGATFYLRGVALKLIEDMVGAKEDFSRDIVPDMVGRLVCVRARGRMIDVGTLERLKMARAVVKSRERFIESGLMYCKKITGVLEDDAVMSALYELSQEITRCWKERKSIYICGNGGSAGNASHIANDLIYGVGVGNERTPSIPGCKVEALTANTAVITCLGNDLGFERVFSEQIRAKGESGDLLIILSGSGNSENIIMATKAAQELKMKTCCIVGFSGGRLKDACDIAIHTKIDDMQISEDCQLILAHVCSQLIRRDRLEADVAGLQ